MKKCSWLVLLAVSCAVMQSLSCSSGQRLQSIAVTPATAKFLDPVTIVNFQLTATGTYTHPPATKDITDQVTWTVDVNNLITVSNAGLVTLAGTGACGVANVKASLKTDNPSGNVVAGTMTVTVADSTHPECPQP